MKAARFPAVSVSHARSTSATVHACAMQPRGVKGGSASKISLSVPTPAVARCASKPSRQRRARLVVRIHLQPRVDERADQPAPHRALVIGGVARAQIAVVLRLVVAMTGRQRAQSDGRQQAIADHVEDRPPALAVEHRVIERDREDLIRPAGRIVALSPSITS